MKNIQLEIGQTYIEDNGPGKTPTRIVIQKFFLNGFGDEMVSYSSSGGALSSYKMGRIRFEGLIRGGVFKLESNSRIKACLCCKPLERIGELEAEVARLKEANRKLSNLYIGVKNLIAYCS